jgi:CubicO group peptidase (beta-lactamase class C family)
MPNREDALHADRRTFLAASAQGILGALACSHFGCRRDNAPPDAPHRTGFDQLVVDLEQRIPKTLRDNAVPGCSIALVRQGEVAWSRGFGVADVISSVPVDSGTIFGALSMSKPVFAYAVLKLCETGVLDLDAPLTRYTPERWVPDDPRLDLITARHVLSHTTGFPNWHVSRSSLDPLHACVRDGSTPARPTASFSQS